MNIPYRPLALGLLVIVPWIGILKREFRARVCCNLSKFQIFI